MERSEMAKRMTELDKIRAEQPPFSDLFDTVQRLKRVAGRQRAALGRQETEYQDTIINVREAASANASSSLETAIIHMTADLAYVVSNIEETTMAIQQIGKVLGGFAGGAEEDGFCRPLPDDAKPPRS